MIETSSTARGFSAWRAAVVGLVAVLAVAIGAVAANFLVSARSIGAGPAAAYVPADAPLYFEMRVIPSAEQDAALRGLLARFPIPDFDAGRPLTDQWATLLDEALAGSDVDFSWSEDVAPWFDGRVAVALTDASVMTATSMQTATPPGMLVGVGVTDAAAAGSFLERMRTASGQEFSSVEHDGTTIWSTTDGVGGTWSYAVASDQLLFAPTADDIADALDRAGGSDSFAANPELGRLSAGLPADWLMFGLVNNQALIEGIRDDAMLTTPEMAPLFDALQGQSAQALVTVVVTPDGVAMDGAAAPPTGVYAVANADRGLAAQVPGDVLYFVEGGNLGPILAEYAAAFKTAAAADPSMADGLDQAEAVLGANLEELVSWIGDGAIAIGYDGEEPYGGIVLKASDPDAAATRVEGLLSLARLSVMDPSIGVTVTESTVGDVEVTTIHWEEPAAAEGFSMLPVSGVSLQVAVDGDRVLIGAGERFVTRVLELDAADSLAQSERFATAIGNLGGTNNVGSVWLDLRGAREAVEAAVPAEMLSGFADYEADVKPWLVPFDYVASVSRVDGDRVLTRMLVAVD
jgi:hypothetical protein